MIFKNKKNIICSILFLIIILLIINNCKIIIYKHNTKYNHNDAINTLINNYIEQEEYNKILTYSILNIKYLNDIKNTIKYKIYTTKNNVYLNIDKINLLINLITLNNTNNDNYKYYRELQKTIITLSKTKYKNIDEYFSTLELFIKLLKNKVLELDFLELLAESSIKIINNFINDYYNFGENTPHEFVIKTYKNIYKYYLKILQEKYNLDINNIITNKNLNKNELKYFLAKEASKKYNNISILEATNTFLIPISKIIGKTTFYYTISKIFNNKQLSIITSIFGTADIGTDVISFTKKVNYNLYAEKIHKINRKKALDNKININITDIIYNSYIFIKNIPNNVYNYLFYFKKIKIGLENNYKLTNKDIINKQINFIKKNNIQIAIAKIKVDNVENNNKLLLQFKNNILKNTQTKEQEINKQIKELKKQKLLNSIDKIIDNKNININYNKKINDLEIELIKFKKIQNNKINDYINKLDNNKAEINKKINRSIKFLQIDL